MEQFHMNFDKAPKVSLPVVFALIGLAGAVQNGGKSGSTDSVVARALLGELGGVWSAVEAIHREKFRISPNCETCASPCGNTSDYDMERYSAAPPELRRLKRELIDAVYEKTLLLWGEDSPVLPDMIYQALSYIKYDLTPESYLTMIERLRG